MFSLLFCSWLSSAVADIPENFRVALQRDSSSQIRVRGIFNRANATSTVVRPWIKSIGCGQRNRFGEHSLTLEGHDGTRANIDVTDMVSTVGNFRTLMGVCIGFDSALSRSVESVMYVNSPEGGEALIFRPTNGTNQVALSGEISYVNIQRNALVYGRTMAGPLGGVVSNEVSQVVFSMNGNLQSTVQNVTFTAIIASIESIGGRVENTERMWRIHNLNNCYDRLLARLPTLHYLFTNHEDPSQQATTRIDLYPEDYLIQKESLDRGVVCELKIIAETSFFPLIISEHFIRRIGGIHFDYANRRIGMFDPL